MSDLLDRIQREIRERLAASRAAVLEYERLERALNALADAGSRATQVVSRRGGGGAAPSPTPPAPKAASARSGRRASSGRKASGGASRTARPRSGGAAARQRAPRGANREAVLRVIGERPGVSANEVAAVSGVKGGTLYALLRTLAQRGEIEKRELPGGQTGYQLASGGASAASEPSAATTAEPPPAAQDAPQADEASPSPASADEASADAPAESDAEQPAD